LPRFSRGVVKPPGMVHDTDIHRPCVQIDSGVELMLCFVESHKGPPVKDFISYYRAFMSINCFNLTFPVVMVCASRCARHKPRQALRAGNAS
jgi:hypothetical protein